MDWAIDSSMRGNSNRPQINKSMIGYNIVAKEGSGYEEYRDMDQDEYKNVCFLKFMIQMNDESKYLSSLLVQATTLR